MPQRMEGVIERVRENKLDALYLFINETLRNRAEFDIFFHNLMNVLPNNWSINRVEIGHEFLSMISNLDELTVIAAEGNVADEGIIAEVAAGNNPNPNQGQQGDDDEIEVIENKQDSLFHWVCSLESLRSLIISDGYIPRKDHGFCDTKSLLRNLPLAKNLQYLDIQRLKLNTTETATTQEGGGRGGETTDDSTVSDSCEDAELLANSLESLTDSLEDIRITSITFCEHKSKSKNSSTPATATATATATAISTTTTTTNAAQRYPLDAAIRVCGDMANLQLLAISCASGSGCNCGTHSGGNNENNNENIDDDDEDEDEDANGEQQQQLQQDGGDGNNGSSLSEDNNITKKQSSTCLVSNEVLLELCRTSTTLQELALRSMRIDDEMCKTIAEAFDPPNTNNHHRMIMPMSAMSAGMKKVNSSNSNNNLMLSTENVRYGGDDIYDDDDDDDASNTNTHSPSFWTSLDLRQNPNIGKIGYNAILASLERNYDLWCSLMVVSVYFSLVYFCAAVVGVDAVLLSLTIKYLMISRFLSLSFSLSSPSTGIRIMNHSNQNLMH
jgi:hypothetical protein